MAEQQIVQTVDELAEGLVLASPSDLPALSGIHTQFETLRDQAQAAGDRATMAEAAQACADLLEQLILGEAADADAAMAVLGKAVEVTQNALRQEQDVAASDLPGDLGLGGGAAPEGAAPFELPAHIDEAIFSEFLARQGGVLEEVETLILSLEKAPSEDDMSALRRIIHTLKGESALLGLTDVETLCHKMEDAFEDTPFSELVDPLLNAKDWLFRTFGADAGSGPAPEAVDKVIAALLCPDQEAVVSEPPPVEQPAPPTAAEEVDDGLPHEPEPLEGDTDLLGDFVVEAREHLDNADVHLLTLESDPGDEEAINAVFRGFHTIKGVAGFLALRAVSALAHEAETLLDRVRKGELSIEGPVVDVIFDSVDALKGLVQQVSEALSTGGLLPVAEGLPGLLARIRAVSAGEAVPQEALPEAKPDMKLGEILVDAGAATEETVTQALEKQREPAPVKPVVEILVEQLRLSRTQVEEALERQKAEPDRQLNEILLEMGAVTERELEAAVSKQCERGEPTRLGEILCSNHNVPAKEVAKALRVQKAAQAPKPEQPTPQKAEPKKDPARATGPGHAVKVREAVKVDADRLDALIDTIGELVIAESMVSQSSEIRGMASTELARHLSQLDKITRELQEMGMSLRMVPVRSTFQKMARLVRDLAKKAGKRVEFVMVGEDTELDKSVVDRIGDPLVHMVRNAVDHGLEPSAEARLEAGKSESGRVELRAFHKGGNIYIEIEDDGRGLNREAILSKAVERGIVQNPEALSDREIWALIFEPGFSTAKQITDVSGRGVGMDVVRRNIEALRGQVEIQSETGQGSVFSIRLPLTLAIIDGMVIRVGGERYIIPTLSIVTSVRPTAEDLGSVVGTGEIFSFQGELIPLFRLGNLFSLDGWIEEATDAIVMVLEDEGRRVGILIDNILGQQQIVIKTLGDVLKDTQGIAGGAIMPDGEVGLILDIGGLVKLAHGGTESNTLD